MTMKTTVLRMIFFALLMGAVATVPALAGSAVIGSVAGSMNASVGGQSLLPNTTIFSGDSLQVRDGVAVIAVGNSSRVIFGRDTVASFLRESNEVTVLLSQGNVSMLHPNDGTPVRVKAGEISITPAAGFKTLGEVAMLNGSVVVTAKEGALQVEDHGATKNVAKGQTIVISPKTRNKGGGNAGWGGGGSTALEVVTIGACGHGCNSGGRSHEPCWQRECECERSHLALPTRQPLLPTQRIRRQRQRRHRQRRQRPQRNNRMPRSVKSLA